LNTANEKNMLETLLLLQDTDLERETASQSFLDIIVQGGPQDIDIVDILLQLSVIALFIPIKSSPTINRS